MNNKVMRSLGMIFTLLALGCLIGLLLFSKDGDWPMYIVLAVIFSLIAARIENYLENSSSNSREKEN